MLLLHMRLRVLGCVRASLLKRRKALFLCERGQHGGLDMKYEEAVRTLNVLQTNHSKPKVRDAGCLVLMQEFLDRISITQDDLKKLNIIHISGTKGKGSTCAFIESILRQQGFKTGFFSSPHLIEVRERIRINGQPISHRLFADYFEEIYGRIAKTAADYENGYPSYFYFMTIMAFHVFLTQRVDVAIMEVGIGGTFDCTNVAQSPSVCGVSTLGYDHTEILGDSLESIAWHKAGIFKPGATAFTSPQPYSALQVLGQSAYDSEIVVQVCPDLTQYRSEGDRKIELGLAGDHQRVNASLALQIAEAWMRKRQQKLPGNEKVNYRSEVEAFPSPATPFLLTENHLDALANCKWRGRAQVLKFDRLTFYLDGAHTIRSMQCCAKWFQEEADNEEKALGTGCTRILVFNVTGNRNAGAMFRTLQDCDISHAVFTPNIATFAPTDCADQTNLKTTLQSQLLCAVHNHEEWLLMKEENRRYLNNQMQSSAGGARTKRDDFEITSDSKAPVFPTIADAVVWLAAERDKKLYEQTVGLASSEKNYVLPISGAKHVQILVTGSVHLVGGFLRILDPDMTNENA